MTCPACQQTVPFFHPTEGSMLVAHENRLGRRCRLSMGMPPFPLFVAAKEAYKAKEEATHE